MPNYYSSSSFDAVDWTMSVDSCHTVRKRNLLTDIQNSSTPTPPPFQDFITLVNTKKRSHTSLSIGNDDGIESYGALPHQKPSPLLDHKNYKYGKIRARPLPNFQYTEASIWTHSTLKAHENLSIDINIVNKYFAKDTKQINRHTIEQRSRTSSTSSSISRPFQILDKSSQITYDVTMRHLLQLLAKTPNQTITIDDVLHRLNTGSINNEWLQCIQRLYKTLTKQFLKRPEDKKKLENYPLENLDQLNLVEQFLIKLLHLPNYNFKLKSYQYRDECQSQLLLLSQSIDHFLQGIDLVLSDKNLPKICQILCFLYNSLSNQSVPGLDLISLVDALTSPTNQTNKTFAHVLVELLDQYYQNDLLDIIQNEQMSELKKLLSIKYDKFYQEIREIHQLYQQLHYEYLVLKTQYDLPEFLGSMFTEGRLQFEKLFQQEYLLKQGEQNLAKYFCSNDLSLDLCLSTVGQFVDKLRLAYFDNEKDKKTMSSNDDRKRSISMLINSSSSFLSCI